MITDKERGKRVKEKFEAQQKKDYLQEQLNEMTERVNTIERSNANLQKERSEYKSRAISKRGGNPSEHPFRIYPIRKKKTGYGKN